jgi:hypothetical protein
VEGNIHAALLGAFAGEPDQVARAINARDVMVAAPREFEGMAALSAAEVKDFVVGLEPRGLDEEVDFLDGVLVVLDDVAVGFQVERSEKRTPPIGGKVAFKVRDRSKGARGLLSRGFLSHDVCRSCGGWGGIGVRRGPGEREAAPRGRIW